MRFRSLELMFIRVFLMDVFLSHFTLLPTVNINKPKPPSECPCIIDFKKKNFSQHYIQGWVIFSPPVSFGTTELRIKPLPLSFLSWIRHAVEIKHFLKHVFICRRHSRKHTNLSKTVNIDYRAAFLLCHKCRSTQLSVCQKSSKPAQDFQMLMLPVSCVDIYSSVRVFFYSFREYPTKIQS